MSCQSKAQSAVELLVTSPTLWANKDYELMIFTCNNDDSDQKKQRRKEHKISSLSNKEGEGAKIIVSEPEFGLSASAFP